MRRTFYVTRLGSVFLVRAPEQGPALQPVYALPDDVEEFDVDEHDTDLLALAQAAESLTRP